MDIHRSLGPGLLESVYRKVLAYELRQANLDVKEEVEIPVVYKSVFVNCGFRADIIVEDRVIIELKAVESILPVHHMQLKTYIKLTDAEAGLLVNFNTVNLYKEGLFAWRK